MNQAWKTVNTVVFSNSFHESDKAYTKWSEDYDQDVKMLGYFPSLEAAQMFVKHGMNSKLLLDVGGGKSGSACFTRFGILRCEHKVSAP